MKAIIIYWSKTGNTEKVARALKDGLEETGMEVLLQNVEGIQDVDWYGYDLVCIGFPSYQWKVPKPMDEFLNKKFNSYRSAGHVKEGAPANEIRATEKPIQDITNKITYKIIEDFRSSNIFEDIDFPVKDSDELIITGDINKFIWRAENNWFAIIFFPLVYFGLPVGDYVGEADITLTVIDNKTGQALGTVPGAGEQRLSCTLYSMSVGEMGSELAEAFRQCVKQLKEKILTEVPGLQ